MAKKKNKDFYAIEGHGKMSRRDFIGQSAKFLSTYALVPSVFSMFHSQLARAACEMPTQVNTSIPVLIFDLGGGANFAGSNVMVGGPGGQLDFISNYQSLGLPMDMIPSLPGQLNNSLGLQFHSDSQLLRGITEETQAATRARVDGGIFATSSSDDTGNNPHNPMYWLAKAGAQGELTQLAGTENSESGARSAAPAQSIDPTIRPVRITRPQDAVGLISVGKLGSMFDETKARKVLETVERLSAAGLQSLGDTALPQNVREVVNCGYEQSKDMIGRYTPGAVDASADADVQALFDLSNGAERETATMAKLVLDGYVGAATVTKGGYDYHTGDRSTGEIRDREAGQLIGKALELAARKNQNLFIYVYTDGGISARYNAGNPAENTDDSADGRGKLNWTGDNGQRAASFILVHGATQRPNLRTPNRRQIGHYKDNGSVENSAALTSNSVTNLVKAVVATYLALHGREGQLANVVGDNPFGSGLEQYILFDQLVNS